MGLGCFENAYRFKRAKQHNFVGKFDLEKHGRFSDVVPTQVAANDAEVETEVLDIDSETDSSEEETDSESEVEVVMSEKEEEAVRQPVPMSTENLAALLISLQGGDGNPPSVHTSVVQDDIAVTSEIEAITDDVEQAASKKQRTDTTPDHDLSGPVSDPEPAKSINPQPDPQSDAASKKTSTEEPDLYDFNFDFKSTPSQPGSSSGVRVETGSSSGAGNTEHDEAASGYATGKRQVIEHSDSDSDEHANVARLKCRVVVLE
ncbi:uncharacterized protein LOC110944643 [Helianthus annuus]|uniref:uncharacterized protein LOC110944643 n=1 Tax=Helianthus annuus TaxID=4232 RepID=UPI000B8F1425|nr:uncharacterized protein LOC110944643 [Helianthus annuus]